MGNIIAFKDRTTIINKVNTVTYNFMFVVTKVFY